MPCNQYHDPIREKVPGTIFAGQRCQEPFSQGNGVRNPFRMGRGSRNLFRWGMVLGTFLAGERCQEPFSQGQRCQEPFLQGRGVRNLFRRGKVPGTFFAWAEVSGTIFAWERCQEPFLVSGTIFAGKCAPPYPFNCLMHKTDTRQKNMLGIGFSGANNEHQKAGNLSGRGKCAMLAWCTWPLTSLTVNHFRVFIVCFSFSFITAYFSGFALIFCIR